MMIASYDYQLVMLSIVVSLLAAYAARQLTDFLRKTRGSAWLVWLALGAVADGIGTWSMHYTGMLAFILPVPVQYDWPTVLLSLTVSIVGSAAALFVVSYGQTAWPQALAASILLGGVGISGMHYTAMAAMRAPATQHHAPALATLAVVLAMVISLLALWLTMLVQKDTEGHRLRRHGSAFLRGIANPAMHYTAMAGVSFTGSNEIPDVSHAISISALGMISIGVVPVMGLIVTLTYKDITEQKQADTIRRLLIDRVMAAQEEERQRLARELHDETGQSLTALLVGLRQIDEMPTLEAARQQAEELRQLTAKALEEVRRLALGLHPHVLDDFGLETALEQYAEEFVKTHGVTVDVLSDALKGRRLPHAVETMLYRIAQEALTNIAKHAHATSASIILRGAPSEMHMIVEDDGLDSTWTKRSNRPAWPSIWGSMACGSAPPCSMDSCRLNRAWERNDSLYVKIPLAGIQEEVTDRHRR